jgi:hypothetical protein
VRNVRTLDNTLRNSGGVADLKKTAPRRGDLRVWTTDAEKWRAWRALWLGDRAALGGGARAESCPPLIHALATHPVHVEDLPVT